MSIKKRTFECGSRSYIIPEHMYYDLKMYIERRVAVGGFLSKVLENDLVGAMGRADNENMANLPAYANFLYNHAPDTCWGSPEKVKAWLEGGKDEI